MNSETVKHLLTIEEASQFLSVKISRLRTAVFKREIPFVKIGRLVRFKESQLKDWIDQKTVKEGADSWFF